MKKSVKKADKALKIEENDEQIFLSSLKTVKKGYLIALAVSSTIALAAIISAVHFRTSFGLLLMVFAIVTYLAIVINLLYSKLGIAYKSYHGGITLTAVYGKNREVVYIPDRIIMLTVTEIGARAFTHESSKSIREIHLPKTILKIGKSAFANLPALTDVYYEGNEAQWNEISSLAPLENVTVHFNEPIPRLEKPKKNKKAKKIKENKKDKKDKKSKNS